MKRVIVTGGAGFIGSAVCRYLVNEKQISVLNLDKLTYAGVPGSLKEIEENPLYRAEQVDVCDKQAVEGLFTDFQPDTVMHLAAESHVDRSIVDAAEFIETNIVGTYNMLECARKYWGSLPSAAFNILPSTSHNGITMPLASEFRFHHISTDEVYGSLGADGRFDECAPYDPRSPYAASKASSDHLVKAWFHTYALPVVMTNCSNNYGPYQYPEKLIPLVILNALCGKPLPVYGKGIQVRDWLYVEDHARALVAVVEAGKTGETYNVGGGNERTNLEVVETICDILDELQPLAGHCKTLDVGSGMLASAKEPPPPTSHLQPPTSIKSYRDLIAFVDDRPGHDMRYAIDATRIETELKWKAQEDFDSGLRKTVQWYLDNEWWWEPLLVSGDAGELLS